MRKKIIDICLLIGIVLLMTPPVTNMKVHEWLGITVLILMIVHQLLNRQYYKTLVKGKYNAYRKFLLSSNILLLIMCLLTMVSGMAISHHATPFLNGIIKGSLAHQLHLACSSWFLTLTGIHLGLNLNALVPLRKLKGKIRNVLTFVVACLAFYGLYVLIQSGMLDYLTLKAQMPYMDFTKTDTDLVLENVLPLIFWTFLGTQLARLFRKQISRQHILLLASAGILTAIAIFGTALGTQKNQSPQNNDWGAMPTAQAETKEGDNNEMNAHKILIAYYSQKNHTRQAAESLQQLTGGDLLEIQPATPYPEAHDPCLQQQIEDLQQEARPAVANKVENMDQYNIIFVGFPI